jgi:cell division protein FtsB
MTDDVPEGPADATSPRQRRRHQSADDVRSARRHVTLWCLSMLLGVLVVSSLIGENGYLATLRARKEERGLQAGLARVRVENLHLQEEAARLREDPSALEEAARRDLGFIRPGETLVIVRDTRPAPPSRR